MNNLYDKALIAWGTALPKQLRELTDHSDWNVFNALKEVVGDIASDNWTIDSKIAWRLMQGR